MTGIRLVASSLLSLTLLTALTACSDDPASRVIGSGDAAADKGRDAKSSDEPDATADLEVASGFTSEVDSIGTRYSLAGAKITNPNRSAAAYDVQVLFNLVSKSGDVLDTQTESVPYVAPGASVPVAPLQIGFDLKQKPTDLRVQVVGDFADDEGPRGPLGGKAAILRVKTARLQPGDFGSELTAQVSNPTKVVAEFASWACIYMRGDRIVGGSSSAIVDPIPPGATVEFGELLPIGLEASNVACQVMTDL